MYKGEVNDFPWINFGLTGPKNIVGERFVVSKHLGYYKKRFKRVEGGFTILRRLFFVSFS